MPGLNPNAQAFLTLLAKASKESSGEKRCTEELERARASLKRYLALENHDRSRLADFEKQMNEAQAQRHLQQYATAAEAYSSLAKVIDRAHAEASSLPKEKRPDDEGRKKLSKRARVEQERQEDLQRIALETGMAIDSIDATLNDPEVRRIMTEHRERAPKEVKTFGSYRWMDDVLQDTTVIDPRKYGKEELVAEKKTQLERRRKILHEINETILAAKSRRGALLNAIDKHKGAPEKSAAVKEAQAFAVNMLNHIPEHWLVESNRLEQRIETLCLDREGGELAKKQAMVLPEETRKQERALFQEIIEHASLKKMDRTAFYFDDPVRSITPEQNVRLMNAYEKIIQRAYRIRDSGGTVEEVESSLEHIPPEFWPPAFLRDLQAWRKVERELAEERVKALSEKNDAIGSGDVLDCFSFVMDNLGFIAVTSDRAGLNHDGVHGATAGQAFIPCAWRDAPAAVEATAAFMAVVQGGWGYGAHVYEMMKTQEFDVEAHPELLELPKRIADENQKFANKMAKIAEEVTIAAKTGLSLTANVGWGLSASGVPGAADFASNVIPGLCAVMSGIDLAQAIAALGQAIRMKGKTGRMLDKAELEWISGKQKDGGAFVRAIMNEKNARNRQIGKKSVEVTAKSLTFAGDTTLSTGALAGVGLALKVTGKSIELGNKVVFAGIDWKIARDAKALIREAQAGNPIARMQVMEDSGLYAKMYICILAKEGDSLASRFITERGITESDLRNPAMALSVLREAMLAHAEQRDETQVSDNLGTALAEGLAGKGTVKVVGKLADGVVGQTRRLGRNIRAKFGDYDPRWEYPGDVMALGPEDWHKNWAGIKKIAPGYYPEKTGIEAALAKCAGPVSEGLKAVAICGPNPYELKGKERETLRTRLDTEARGHILDQVNRAVAVLEKASQTIMDARPVNVDGTTHAGVTRYLAKLCSAVNTRKNHLDGCLFAIGIKDAEWKPIRPVSLHSADWEANWKDAVQKCLLSEDDKGVGAALETYEQMLTGDDLNGANKLRARKARISMRDELAKAARGLKALWPVSAQFPNLRDEYLDAMMGVVIKASQENDQALNGRPWPGNPAKQPVFTEKMWRDTVAEAEKEGYLEPGRGGDVAKAFGAWETARRALEELKKPAAKIEERKKVARCLIELVKGLDKLIAANRDTHSELLAYFIWVRREAGRLAADLRREQSGIVFDREQPVEVVKGRLRVSVRKWQNTYAAAVEEGAVPENKSVRDRLAGVLESLGKKLEKLEAPKVSQKEKFKLANQAQADLASIQKAISTVLDTEGYADNEAMEGHLADMRDIVSGAEQQEPLKSVLLGLNDAFPKQEMVWLNKGRGGWQEVKQRAENAGLIFKSRNKTGFGAAIVARNKAIARYEKVKDDPKKREKARNELLASLDAVLEAAQTLRSNTGNVNFRDYFQQAIDDSKENKERFQRGGP